MLAQYSTVNQTLVYCICHFVLTLPNDKTKEYDMIRTGLATLIDDHQALLGNRRVGLVTQSAAVLPDLTDSVDALRLAGVHLTALFGPEHGLRGAAPDGASVAHARDPISGLPVYSLYGPDKMPTPEMLREVDALVFDMQDVGVRFYTYLSTLHYILKAAGQAGKSVLVLDRPNPITGTRLEGPLVEPGFESFIGILAGLPIRHAMTFGEMARYIAGREAIDVDLRVVQMEGWRRSMWFDQTGLPWVTTSPAMPHLSTTVVYPGMCFLEGTSLSEGRGTSLPFEVAGAPWMEGYAWAAALNRLELPGVRFRPMFFQPYASKYANETCSGVQLFVTNREIFAPVRTALHLIVEARKQAPASFAFRPSHRTDTVAHFDLELGSEKVREALLAGASVDEITQDWPRQQAEFWESVHPYLLYE